VTKDRTCRIEEVQKKSTDVSPCGGDKPAMGYPPVRSPEVASAYRNLSRLLVLPSLGAERCRGLARPVRDRYDLTSGRVTTFGSLWFSHRIVAVFSQTSRGVLVTL